MKHRKWHTPAILPGFEYTFRYLERFCSISRDHRSRTKNGRDRSSPFIVKPEQGSLSIGECLIFAGDLPEVSGGLAGWSGVVFRNTTSAYWMIKGRADGKMVSGGRNDRHEYRSDAEDTFFAVSTVLGSSTLAGLIPFMISSIVCSRNSRRSQLSSLRSQRVT